MVTIFNVYWRGCYFSTSIRTPSCQILSQEWIQLVLLILTFSFSLGIAGYWSRVIYGLGGVVRQLLTGPMRLPFHTVGRQHTLVYYHDISPLAQGRK